MIYFILYKYIFLILMVKIIHCQDDSSCHKIIQVYKENKNHYARITVPIPKNHNNFIKLTVQLQIGNALFPNQYWRKKLQLFGTIHDALRSILHNTPLVFKLEYPSSNDIVFKITYITINNQVLCSAETLNGFNQISSVNLSSSFRLDNFGISNYNNSNLNGIKYNDNNNFANGMKTTTHPPINKFPFITNQFTEKASNNQKTSQSLFPGHPDSQNKNLNLILTKSTVQPYTKNHFDTCGKIEMVTNQLIANGQGAQVGNHPWMGALFLRDKNLLSPNFRGGASLIAKKLALTAGHCVTKYLNSELYVIFGRVRMNDWLDENTQRGKVAKIELHPEYKKDNSDADIAILYFANEITYTFTVQPVCLWETSMLSQNIVNKTGVVVGWGVNENNQITENLQQLYLRVVSGEQCFHSSSGFHGITSNRTFCAGSNDDNSGPCGGDSGGGFYFYVNERWYIRGIVSRALQDPITRRCDFSKYAVFLDVAKHFQWIRKFL